MYLERISTGKEERVFNLNMYLQVYEKRSRTSKTTLLAHLVEYYLDKFGDCL